MKSLKEDKEFDTIRVAEPDLQDYQPLPITQLCSPSFRSKILYSKPADLDNLEVSKQYFSVDREYTDKLLGVLKKKNCTVRKRDKERFKDLQKAVKSGDDPNLIVFQDQYKDFLVFESEQIDVIITVCFAILDHNRDAFRKREQLFLPFFYYPL